MQQHKSDFIDWRDHPTLNNVTKLGIQYFENAYTFDAYLDDRSKKDNKFVNPLLDDAQEESKRKNNNEDENGGGSEFSMSAGEEEDEENMSQGMHWERGIAE
jgi:hypothetical protein